MSLSNPDQVVRLWDIKEKIEQQPARSDVLQAEGAIEALQPHLLVPQIGSLTMLNKGPIVKLWDSRVAPWLGTQVSAIFDFSEGELRVSLIKK